jgi:hypothetical protein
VLEQANGDHTSVVVAVVGARVRRLANMAPAISIISLLLLIMAATSSVQLGMLHNIKMVLASFSVCGSSDNHATLDTVRQAYL